MPETLSGVISVPYIIEWNTRTDIISVQAWGARSLEQWRAIADSEVGGTLRTVAMEVMDFVELLHAR